MTPRWIRLWATSGAMLLLLGCSHFAAGPPTSTPPKTTASAATKAGDVVFVPVSDSHDDAMDAQAFDVSRYLVGRRSGKLMREVSVSEAGNDIFSSYNGE